MPTKTVIKPIDGLIDSDLDTGLILPSQATYISNVKKYFDHIGQRSGRVDYGFLSGSVMSYFHFKVGNINRFLKFTSTKIAYKATSGWTDVTGSDLTGDLDNFIDSCMVYDNTAGTWYVVFTNNKDNIRTYTGTGNTSDLSNWTAYKGKFVRYYQGYFILANITFGGTHYPFRFRCSHTDEPNNITGVNSKNFNLTKDRRMSDIMGIEHFDNFLAFYKTDCIYLVYLGSSANVFEWDVAVQRTGLRASRAIAEDEDGSHCFMGFNGIYYWDSPGSQPVELSTNKIRRRLLDNTDPQLLSRSFMTYDERNKEFRVYVPESNYLNKVYAINKKDAKWSWWEEDVGNITAVGSYLPETLVTIDDLTGTIDSLTGTIDSLSGTLTSNFKYIIEGDKDGNSVFIDKDTYNDKNISISSRYDTGDDLFEEKNEDGEPFNYKRILGLRIEAKGLQSTGDRLYVYYSNDEGITWAQITAGITSSGTTWENYISLNDEWEWYECHFDVYVDKIRFSFRNEVDSSTWLVRKWIPLYEDEEGQFNVT